MKRIFVFLISPFLNRINCDLKIRMVLIPSCNKFSECSFIDLRLSSEFLFSLDQNLQDHHKVFEGIDNDYVINERTSLMLTMDIKDVVVKGDTGATAFVRFIEPTERSTLDRPRLH
ncbi:hypothetical protein RIR_jg29155.t1 [Rhizophagus irregularis DAOM 181602=DAOM 197198]|uniref:Uncharacterized protein n=1 Tax=Rhizophagus irregularis (strain DAOM 181602 / DAOM 197198 / MUCL 43194) TaxID=747089 RepID=U9UR63_RHIID|nr:hypothetical protein RIR_jg29155.t1 [Rhizophagus irregularis DAOM 181602=DAOM 197198]